MQLANTSRALRGIDAAKALGGQATFHILLEIVVRPPYQQH